MCKEKQYIYQFKYVYIQLLYLNGYNYTTYRTQHMSINQQQSFSNDSLVKSHDNLSICIQKELQNNQIKIDCMREFIDNKTSQLAQLQNYLVKEFQDIQNFKDKHNKIQTLVMGQLRPTLVNMKVQLKSIVQYAKIIPQQLMKFNQQIIHKFNQILVSKDQQINALKQKIKQNKVQPIINQSEYQITSQFLNSYVNNFKNIQYQQRYLKKFQLQNFKFNKVRNCSKQSSNLQKEADNKQKNQRIQTQKRTYKYTEDSLQKLNHLHTQSAQVTQKQLNSPLYNQKNYNKQHFQYRNSSRLDEVSKFTPQKIENQKSLSSSKLSRESLLKRYKRNISEKNLSESKLSPYKYQHSQLSSNSNHENKFLYQQISSIINSKVQNRHNKNLSIYSDNEQIYDVKTQYFKKIRQNQQSLNKNNKFHMQKKQKQNEDKKIKSPIKDRKKYIKQKIQRIKQRERQKQRQRQKSTKKIYF